MIDNEYRINVKITNNLILSKIESLGFESLLSFCKYYKICYPSVINLINMKEVPIKNDRGYRKIVYELCDIFKCFPEELFSETQMENALESNKITYQAKESEIKFVLQQQLQQKSLEDMVDKEYLENDIKYYLSKLSPREAKVLSLRFGFNDEEPHTYKACGDKLNISTERARQIEAKALRKLRHPRISEFLKQHVSGE